ncbi:MAG: hypothetical protein D8M58_11225 [Calditrichaeota bacterium]|nr:MAG: hypothetical protein DWQ03_10600 [Calditrichota bacterium]MBL1205964.1 hypothetical protein [Calditrichota bacterium]NOG45792.1 hypothetical protein [Calditrichota bacterium]
MIKKSLLSLGIIFSVSSFLFAGQGDSTGNDYMWTQDFGTPRINYNWIDIKDGTSLFFGGIDNQLSTAIPLPFTFYFYGQAKSNIYVSANGYITFVDQGVTTDPFGGNVTIPSASAPDSMIAPYWGELTGGGTQQANVYVKSVGSAPFRQYVIQWHLPDGGSSVEFQAILYEGSNNIKFQWGKMDVGDPGGSETVGLQATSSKALEYSFDNTPGANSISEYTAVLFHGEGVSGVDAAISPSSVSTSTSQEFTYVFNNISPSSTDLLGKLDSVAITLPAAFSSTPTVTSIKINDGAAFIQNSATKPEDRGFATWQVSGSNIIVQTADFEVIDSLIVKFIEQTPAAVSSGNSFTSEYGAELDTTSGPQSSVEDALGWDVDVTAAPGTVDYYTFTPATDTSLIAGNNLAFTVTAYDEFGATINNSDNVVFTASGSSTVTFSANDTLNFSGGSTVLLTVSDVTRGDFTLKAQKETDASVTGTSGLVTVNPDNIDHINELSSSAAITAGTQRTLRVAVLDIHNNRVGQDSIITFTVTSGTGSFTGDVSVITGNTNAVGEAEALYTASTTSGGNDVITVSFGGVSTPITLPVSADNVSYYSFNPSTPQPLTAGGAGVPFDVTARDQYDNIVTSTDSVIFSAEGSSTATFSPNDSISIASGTTVSVTVQDNTAGTFNIKATRLKDGSADATVTGTSGLFTVSSGTASTLTEVSSNSAIKAGTTRRLQVRVDDAFGNPVSGASVSFAINAGSGSFSGSNPATSDANGIAFVDYTSSETSGGNDVIDVTSAPATAIQITLPVSADNVSYYSFNPSTPQSITAGGAGVAYVVTAFDQYDNIVTSTDSVIFSAEGSSTATFSPNDSISIASGTTVSVTVQDNTAGTFNIKATRLSGGTADATVIGSSGLITVSSATASSLTEVSSSSAIKAGTTRRLQVRVDDAFGNPVSGASVTFAINAGSGSFSGSNPATSDANGIAFVDYTSSETSGGNDVIDVTSAPATAIQITLPVSADNVSYYSFNPSTAQAITAGGAGVAYVVTAYDQYDNIVTSTDSVIFTAEGSSTATFSPNDSLSIASGTTVSVTVQDNTAGTFNIKATRLKDGSADATVTGTSGLFTVSSGTASTLTEVSSNSAIKAGTTRRLQVRVDDAFGNPVSGASITFAINAGSGSFSGSNPATSDANGIAFVDYTSSETSGGNDVIDVTSAPATAIQITLPVSADNVSYYSFNPSTPQPLTAGGAGVPFDVTARDQYDNIVTSTDSVIFSAEGSSTATFSPNDSISIASGTTVSVTVQDNTAGTFNIKATRLSGGTADATVTGTSGLFTVSSGTASTLTEVSSNSAIKAGTTRRLQVRVDDAFGNPVSGASVTFAINTGGGSLTGTNPATSDANGIAFVDFRADTVSGGNDVIDVTSAPATAIQITLPVDPGSVSYYTFSPATDSSIIAGVNIQFTLTAKDQFGNDVINNGSVTLDGQGSSTETFSSGPYSFGGSSTLIFTVSDTTAGSFTVVAENTITSTISGQSGLVTVSPAAAAQFSIISSTSDIVAGTDRLLQVGLEDQYGNRLDDGSNVTFSTFAGTGTFSGANPDAIDANGVAEIIYTASSTSGADDSISVSFNSGAVLDTIALPVISGSLAEIRIQITNVADGTELGDSTITADETITAYAWGYDATGNSLGLTSSTWTGSGVIGAGNLNPVNPTDNITFTPTTSGTGKLTATDAAGGIIDDISGVITVNAGATDYVLIMDAPGGTGSQILTPTLTTGEVLNLYANGFDVNNNFTANESVTWGVTGTLDAGDLDPNPGSSTVFLPTSTGAGTITTTSAFTEDATGTITVNTGALASLQIRTASGGGGVVVSDTTKAAGDSLTLYAAGYDANDNFIADQNVQWTVEGDTIGFFETAAPTTASTNKFYGRIVNAARLRINSGSINNYSGIVKVTAGTPATLTAVSSQTFTGSAGNILPDSLAVRLTDDYGNVVPNATIAWTSTTNDGATLSPSSDPTDVLGVSRSSWRLRNSSTAPGDTARATYTGLPFVEFRASVSASNADSLKIDESTDLQIGVVNSELSDFVVSVVDSINNPVPGVVITFSVTGFPNGASGYSLSNVSIETGVDGKASTKLTLGNKVGTYEVTAFNASLATLDNTFSAEAIADAVSSLSIFSGNDQSGTVGSALTNDIIVTATDSSGNHVTGATVTWQATADGVVNNVGQPTTGVAGRDTVSWTLRTTSGPDTLLAILAGLDTVTYVATANADVANSIVVISGDGKTTVAGSNQKIEARVLDQYGNNVSGQYVSFLPANSMSALVSTSNDTGLVSAVYRAPSNQDSSTARAIIVSPADTAFFKVYGLSYVSNSLAPKSVAAGDDTSFTVQVNNPGPNSVSLNTDSSTFVISDGTINTTESLNTPAALPANSATTLTFNSAVIDNFASGSYTPEITLVGSGSDALMNGTLFTDVGELSVSPLQIDFILIPNPEDTLVSVGTSIAEIQMQVTNNGNNTIRNVIPLLSVSPEDYTDSLLSGADTILAGNSEIYKFNMVIPGGSPFGLKTIDGSVTGLNLSESVSDIGADQTENFRVIESASFDWDNYSPQTLSEGQVVTFTVDVTNNGLLYDVILNKNTTSLTFGADVFNLASNQTLPANETTTLTFESGTLGIASGTHEGTLVLNGTEVGNSVSSTITTTAASLPDLTVQTIANLVFNPLTLSSDPVSQGQNGEQFTISVTNDGEASYKINSPDSITVLVGGVDISILGTRYSSTLTSHELSDFPVIVANSDPQNFIYTIDITDAATPGTDTFSSRIAATDLNSDETTETTSGVGVNPSWDVLAKSALSVTSLNATATQVSQGQSGLTVDVILENTGQATATVDSVYLDFLRNANSFTHNATFPETITGGGSLNIQFSVAIDSGAATGIDSIRAIATGQNSLSSESLSETSAYLDAWDVFDKAKIIINAVTSTSREVNRGQTGVPVTVTVSNEGLGTVLIDNLQLNNTNIPPDLNIPTSDTQITTPDSILSGQTISYQFQSEILSDAANKILLGARFEGRDAISNASVVDSVSAVSDTLFVGDPSALQIDSVFSSFYSFSQGQENLDVRVRLTNTGNSKAFLDSIRLDLTSAELANPAAGNTLGYSQITTFEVQPFTLPASQSTVVLFRLNSPTTARDSGNVEINARAYGTDALTSQALTDLSADANKDTVLLQTPANPVITRIENKNSVTTGEQDVIVSLRVKNLGSATARLENVLLNFFNSINASVNDDYARQYVSPDLPHTLLGWDSTDVTYSIDVGADATQGIIDLRGIVQSTELNRNLSTADTSATLNTWTVIGTGELSVLSVLPDRDSVSTGQQNVPVTVTVQNGGDTNVRIDSLALSVSRGSYDSLYVLPGDVLIPSESAQYIINVDVAASSISGVATLDASVLGVDLGNGSVQISDANSDSTASWLVQQAVDIAISDNSPVQVSTDQPFVTKLTVVNSGEARLEIDTSATKLYPKDTPANFAKLADSSITIIEGNQTVQLVFNSTTSSPAFVDSLKLELVGVENNDTYNNIHTAPNEFVVQSQAVMSIASTDAVADSVSHGQTEQVTITIDNSAQAGLVVDSLIINEYGKLINLSPALPFTISGGSSQAFVADIDVTNLTATGDISLDVNGYGHDANNTVVSTNDEDGATTPDSWFVTTAPVVAVSNVTSLSTIVTQGQSGVPVDVTVRNDGETPVLVTNMNLLPRIGLYSQSWPAFNFRINGNDSATVTVTVDVAANSATGTDSLFAQVDFQNIYSGETDQDTSTVFHEWSIAGTSTVDIVSIQADPSNVSQGQGPINVQIRLQNTGTSSAIIDAVSLDFRNGNSNYFIDAISPALPFTLNSGLDRVFTIPVTVNNNAQTGLDSVFAQVNVTEGVSGTPSVVTDPLVFDSWDVQVRPAVVIDSVSVNPAQASTGQNGLTASVYVSNRDSINVNRASAQLDSVRLVMNLASIERNDQFTISRSLIPSIPLILQEGTSTRIDFDLDVNPTALTGTYTSDAYLESQDINDGSQSINNNADLAGSLLVQNSAALAVDTVWVTPDSISQGQSHGRIYVQVTNTGQAPATITGSDLTFDPVLTDLQEQFIDPATPFILGGGLTDTLTYSFVASPSFNGLVEVNGTVNGEDNNSGSVLAASNVNPTQFLIQTPANPTYTTKDPQSSSGGELIQFRVKIFNSGEATIVLDPAQTTIKVGDFDPPLALDISSPTIIAATPDTTELIFIGDSLNGLAPGDHSLQVRLKGTTNKADYENTLDAGSFAFGAGLIVITDIGFETSTTVLQGTQDNLVKMLITNSSAALPIDSVDTKLIFTLDGSEEFVENLRRNPADTLTILPVGDSELRFIFDVQSTYPIGDTEVSGRLSLDGGSIVENSADSKTMTVLSGANATYITTSPDSVINNQKVSFQLDFGNTGTAGLALNPDSTYIEFPGFVGIPRKNLAGNFTLGGNDTTTITFSEITIPESASGIQNITWRIKGEMLNGGVFDNTGNAASAFEIIPSATLSFDPIVALDNQVLRGQDSVQIDYTVQNDGASDAIVTGMDFDFTNKGSSVQSQWVNISTGLFPDTVFANNQKTFSVLYNVSQDADTGFVTPEPSVDFRDIRTQHISETSTNVVTNDQIEVIVPASIRIDSLYFATAGNTPNAPLVNDGQSFILAVDLTNNGAVTVASGSAILKKGTTAVDTVSILNLVAGSSASLSFKKDSISTIPANDPVYSVTLESIMDIEGNTVNTEQALDNSERVIVQDHRTLSITSQTNEMSVTDGQVFQVNATIGQSGESNFEPGSIQLVLPANFEFANGSVLSQVISVDTLTRSWDVRALSPSVATDTLKIQFASIPLDVNTGNPVTVLIPQADVPVTVENQGNITLSNFINSGPVASRDTVSTGQQFDLSIQVSLNKMLQDTTATLNLPEGRGYSVIGGSAKAVTGPVVTWQVVAPAQLPEQGANTDTFSVSVNGNDINTGNPVTRTSGDLIIHLERVATLSLSSAVINPAGAVDGILSTEQTFEFQTQVSNSGHADFDGSGSVLLEAHGGLLFEENGDSTLVLPSFTTDAINKIVIVPDKVGSASITSTIQDVPKDENSLQDASVKVDLTLQNYQVIKRANLRLTVDKTGAEDNQITRATGQAFEIVANVVNSGQAGLDTTSGRHFLVLDTTGTGIELLNNEETRKPFYIHADSFVTWNVSAPGSQALSTFYVTVETGKHPLDENENVSAFREASSARDSLTIDFIEVRDIDLDAKYKDGSTTTIVAINQEEIFLEADITFDPQLDKDKRIDLILPTNAGYSIQQGNLSTDFEDGTFTTNVSWMIKAPELKSTQTDSILISVFGASSQGFDKTTEQKLAIKTVAIARLELELSIDQPDGAADGEVSEGQAFRLRGEVINLEETDSPVSGTGEVQLVSLDTQYFAVFDTTEESTGLHVDASLIRSFKVTEPFYWWVKATGETPISSRALFNGLINKKVIQEKDHPEEAIIMSIAEKKAVRNKLQKAISEFNAFQAEGSPISVKVTKSVTDIQLDTTAQIKDSLKTQTVKVIGAAFIRIASTSSPESVSTGQVFTYTVTAGEMSDHLVDPRAEFILPESFASDNQLTPTVPLSADNTASLNINVPQDYAGSPTEDIQVFLIGKDDNKQDDSQPSIMITDQIKIQKRPDIELKSIKIKPVSAINKRQLSYGQELEIRVWTVLAQNTSLLNYAEIEGEGTITLDTLQIFKDGFILSPGEVATKTFSSLGEENALTWKIIAPQNEVSSSSIIFNLTGRPIDKNSGIEVLSGESSVTHSIQVRQKEIILIPKNDLLASTSFLQGATDLTLLAFEISNEGYGDTLFVDSLSVGFHSASDDPTSSAFVDPSALVGMFSKIKVVNEDYILENLGKTGSVTSAEIFADVDIVSSVENPIGIQFESKMSLAPDSVETIAVLVDFKPDAKIQGFRTKLEDITIFDVDDSFKLTAVSETGAEFIGSSDAASENQIIISKDSDKNFYIYPNPFGRGDTDEDRRGWFNVHLDQTSEVAISIYTVLGELVWKSETKILKGTHDKQFFWDGKNGKGKRVLNGAYIGVLEVRPTNGGAVKRSIIKIAYIK